MKKQFENRLSHKVRTTLNHYRPTYEPTDWAAMEAKLQANAPVPAPGFYSYLLNPLSMALTLTFCLLAVLWPRILVKNDLSALDYIPETGRPAIETLSQSEVQKPFNTKQIPEPVTPEPATPKPATPKPVAPEPVASKPSKARPSSKTLALYSSAIPPSIPAAPTAGPAEFPIIGQRYFGLVPPPEQLALALDQASVTPKQLIAARAPKMPNPYQPKVELAFVGTLLSNYRRDLMYKERNYGGGLMLNFMIGERLALGTGFLFNRQTSNGLVERTLRLTENRRTVVYNEAIPTKATFQLLDIPLTIQYRFKSRQKLSMYLVGGVSNLLYVGETYQQTRFPILSDGRRSSRPSTEQKDYGSLHRLDLLANVTLGFGVKYHFGPVTSLAVEPFLNVPTKNYGDQQIPVQAIGMHIKLNYGIKTQK